MNKQAEQQWMNQAACVKAERAALIIDQARIRELLRQPMTANLQKMYDGKLADINIKLRAL